ncbi:hypothetical protein EVA_17255 [gut metagenome]|uniref:Uncharacterized protein n=1 Tax=gut metagenome TaxID=749906 RepID=J9FYL7_9ZZZZ
MRITLKLFEKSPSFGPFNEKKKRPGDKPNLFFFLHYRSTRTQRPCIGKDRRRPVQRTSLIRQP